MRWSKKELRVLDFDVETIAAGFADPEWVPQKITCCAWSWVGEDEVHSTICSPNALYGPHSKQRKFMLIPLLHAIEQADILTGHNIARFDLPVINSECMRLGLDPIRSALVQDTMRLLRSKGFKKGQDNLGELLKTEGQKLGLNWQQWEDAYAEKGWPVVRQRAESDVLMHKEIRTRLAELGYLKPPVVWHA